ncbi:hypothetical protein TIFTF001_008585 [Ficus carica]|uniref:J domain-containing protein n=1 Tax=Ficus carica TaxID=3494 RepID=A0AA88D1V4_FICCA|nr:hypothetical protein TIFTF001_008585 [Ficus carica]
MRLQANPKKIGKAYRAKAVLLHPNKRPNDPNAHANFQTLTRSYDVLKDEKARKLYDEGLKNCKHCRINKRRPGKALLEAEERELEAKRRLAEEEAIDDKPKEELAAFRAMCREKDLEIS